MISNALLGVAIGQVFGLAGSNLLALASRSGEDQCDRELSFLLTAAGQSRIFTGFPFQC